MASIRSEEQALHEIISLIPSRSNDISILDILQAFDSYIGKTRIKHILLLKTYSLSPNIIAINPRTFQQIMLNLLFMHYLTSFSCFVISMI